MTVRHLLKLTVALLGVAAASPALADGLIDNVAGVTLDAEGQVRRFTGMVVSDDGRVVRLLGPGESRPSARLTFRKDGRGAALMPGLIDAHGHVMGLGFQALTLDLSGTRSLAEAQEAIRRWVAANPDAPWIIGRGWNQELWGLGRFPTAAELDAVTGGKPAYLERVDGHAGWANSAAMRVAGIANTTRAPAGGRIERDAAGRATGVFVDAAMPLIERFRPAPLARDRDAALARAQERLLSLGVTTVADMGTTIEDWQAFRRAGDAGRLNVRIIGYGAGTEQMTLIAGSGPTPWLYNDRLRLVGVKLYLDGALGSRGAWLKAPYSDAPGQRGLPLLTPSQLRNQVVRASMDGFQIAVHAIGDAANAELLSAIEEVAPSYPGDRRWRIEHAQVIDTADIARLGRHGIVASMQPVHQSSDRLMATARLGEARLAGAYAWRSVRGTGARLALGSDFPVESADPFAGLAAAVSRTDREGQPVGGWRVEEALTREQALDGFTRSAAYAGMAEDRLGTLMPGMRADFILLERAIDPLSASAEELRNARVMETWVGGRPAWARAAR